jgi:hypothetical protein
MYQYIAFGDPRAVQHHMRYHGPVLDTGLYALEKALGLTDPREIYRMRHLAYFLVFYAGVFFFFRLIERYFGGWKLGLLGAGLLVASPRVFADSFFNPKDLPFLSFFIIGVYSQLRYLERKSLAWAAWHALASATLVATRAVGVVVPLLTLGLGTLDIFRAKDRKRAALTLAAYGGLATGLSVLFWPTLWRDPLFHLFQALAQSSRYGGWPGTILYLGEHIAAVELPWHYLPVWIAITTPPSYLLFFAVGCFVGTKQLLRSPGASSPDRRKLLLVVTWFFLPVLAAIVFESVLYDGWRHLFFLYPALLLIALLGIRELWRRGRWAQAFLAILAVDLADTVRFMAQSHPHQNVYFNRLIGGVAGAEGEFDLDYWGLSYREGLEYVLDNDPRSRLSIAVAHSPGKYNANLLPAAERGRLQYVEAPEADYLLTNFRFQSREDSYGEELHSVRVEGVRILSIYRSEKKAPVSSLLPRDLRARSSRQ